MIYDIIGDLHGHADELTLLLEKLGYHKKGGIYSQAGHQAIFVGDFIDRGPKIRETLTIVRKMVDKGTALAVMGNHEFNAICYHTRDGRGFLRSHTAKKGKNRKQHQETIEQMVKECFSYLETHRLFGIGLEWNDLQLLVAAQLNHARLWSLDRPLAMAAKKLDLLFSDTT